MAAKQDDHSHQHPVRHGSHPAHAVHQAIADQAHAQRGSPAPDNVRHISELYKGLVAPPRPTFFARLPLPHVAVAAVALAAREYFVGGQQHLPLGALLAVAGVAIAAVVLRRFLAK